MSSKTKAWEFCKTYDFCEVVVDDDRVPLYTDILEHKIPVESIEDINHFVYVLLNHDEVVYVGQTVGPAKRLPQHRDKTFTHFSLIKCAPGYYVSDLEAQLIVLHKPKYNRTLPRNSKYKTVKQIVKTIRNHISTNKCREIIDKYNSQPIWKDYYNFKDIYKHICDETMPKRTKLEEKIIRLKLKLEFMRSIAQKRREINAS